MFGSGASHAIYAQFMAQSALANKGRKVCLIRGAGTRMALWFYAMIRLIRLQQPLKATIHQQQFLDLALTTSAKGAVQDIKDDNFWKCMYILLRAVFPALRALRYCDSNTPCMDKLYYLSHRTTVAIEKSQDDLNDKSLFGSLKTNRNLLDEGNIALGSNLNNSADHDDDDVVFHDDPLVGNGTDDEDSDDEPETPGNTTMSFARQVCWHWNKRKLRIEHEYSITAWALCVMGSVRNDVRDRLTGHHRDAIEKVVSRLHVPPCPNTNPAILTMLPHEIIDTFWNEFKAFQNCTNPYHEMSRWASADCVSGKSYLWHEKYSLPYTVVLGYVGCRVTSKLCGIGPAERSWGGVKQIKDGVRSHLSGESTEKRSVIYVSAKIQEARMRQHTMEKLDATGADAMFGDDDINFDLQLEKFGVNTNILKEPAVERIFHSWVEEWEEEARKKNDCVSEALLLQKYKGLVFHDPDSGHDFSIWHNNMEFRRGRGNGWVLIGVCAEDGVEDEAFTLELACEMIADTPQKDSIQVVQQETDLE